MSDHISDQDFKLLPGECEVIVESVDNEWQPYKRVPLAVVLNDLSSRLREQSATIEAMRAEIEGLKANQVTQDVSNYGPNAVASMLPWQKDFNAWKNQ